MTAASKPVRSLAVSSVPSVYDLGEIAGKSATWDDLTDFLANRAPEAATKEGLRLMKLAKFGNVRTAKSLRCDANIEHLSGLIGEHDAGTVSLDDAAKRLEAAEVGAFLYTSPSHMQDGKGPRWRVLVPLMKDTPPAEHTRLMDRLNGALGGALAAESWTLSQVFYYGKVTGRPYETRKIKGHYIDHSRFDNVIKPISKPAAVTPKVFDDIADEPQSGNHPMRAVVAGESADIAELRKLIAGRDPDMPEPEWWKLGAILYAATQGSAAGYELYDEWSSRGTKYEGRAATLKKWNEISRRKVDNPATVGQLRRDHVATLEDFGPPLPAQADAPDITQDERPTFTWHSPEWIVAQPDPVWLVDELIPQSTDIVFFAGLPGAGKSFLALSVGLAMVRGTPWFGADVEQGAVGYIAAEAFGTFNTRMRAYLHKHNVKPGEIADFKLLGAGVNLTDKVQMQALAESARTFAPKLIVVDTLAAAAGGIDHNSSEMQKVIDGCKLLQRVTGATILVVAHHGKDESKGIMGWTGLTANAETICAITKDDATVPPTHYLKVVKQRNGIEGKAHTWQLEQIALGVNTKGRPVVGATVCYLGLGGKRPKVVLGKNEQAVYDMLTEHDRKLTVDAAVEHAVELFDAPGKGEKDRRRARAREALKGLRDKRLITENDDGKLCIGSADTPSNPDAMFGEGEAV